MVSLMNIRRRRRSTPLVAGLALWEIQGINESQMYGSLEVQAIRLYLGVRSDQVTVQFDQTGVVRLDFGSALQLKTDATGRNQINYHGPKRTYPTIRWPTSFSESFSKAFLKNKLF